MNPILAQPRVETVSPEDDEQINRDIQSTPTFAHLTELFFVHRSNIAPFEIPSLFGVWCQMWVQARGIQEPTRTSCTYEKIHASIMHGDPLTQDEHLIDVIARVVAYTQPARYVKQHSLYKPSSHDKTRLCLHIPNILALEAYVYAHYWPQRLSEIISRMNSVTYAPPAPHPSTIFTWLNRVANSGIPHSTTERMHKELYCAINTPMCVAVRKPPDMSAYVCLRDWNNDYPVDWFAATIRAAVEQIPCDIFNKPQFYSNNPILVASACIATLEAYIKFAMVDDSALIWPKDSTDAKLYTLKIHTYADAHPDTWCSDFSIYFDGHLTYIRLPGNIIICPHITQPTDDIPYAHSTGPDIVYAYVGCLFEYFSDHPKLPEVWENLQRPKDIVQRIQRHYDAYA